MFGKYNYSLISDEFNLSRPFSYVKHLNFLDTTEFNMTNPIYINIVRHPVDRIISWYYYIRAPWYLLKKNPDDMTLKNNTGASNLTEGDPPSLRGNGKWNWKKDTLPSLKLLKTSFHECVRNERDECVYRKGNIYIICNYLVRIVSNTHYITVERT